MFRVAVGANIAIGAVAAASVVRSFATGSPKLWGGRFSKDTDAAVLDWVDSIPVDKNLREVDIWGSMAHVTALGTQGIIPPHSAQKILNGLLTIEEKFQTGELVLGTDQDDVHMDIEAKLLKLIGMEDGGRMHTCRSRNDQVALDSTLYCRKRLLELRKHTLNAAEAFLIRAADHLEDVMVGYTHVQHAQPVSLAFWLSHYGAVLLRDAERLEQAYNCTDKCVLGAGALAGTSFPIDRELTAKLLGFQKIHEHAMDGTSSRDYMLQSVCAVAILHTTLSRLADELIMWSSNEFRTVTLDDGFAMGSSMMPQKKNPGTLELLRGRAGRINGLVTAAFTMMKGLPSGYNRDFHEDKEILVETFDLANRATSIIPALVKSTTFNLDRMAELPMANFSTATELANFLVSKHQVPFREAHHIVGSLVGKLVAAKKNLTAIDDVMAHLAERGVKGADKASVLKVLDGKQVMLSYESRGGTGPVSVRTMLNEFERQHKELGKVLATDQSRVDNANNATHAIARAASASASLTREELKNIVKKLGPQ